MPTTGMKWAYNSIAYYFTAIDSGTLSIIVYASISALMAACEELNSLGVIASVGFPFSTGDISLLH